MRARVHVLASARVRERVRVRVRVRVRARVGARAGVCLCVCGCVGAGVYVCVVNPKLIKPGKATNFRGNRSSLQKTPPPIHLQCLLAGWFRAG